MSQESSWDLAELVQRVEFGETDAVAELYRRMMGHRVWLLRRAGRQDGEDVFHNLFTDVLDAIRRGKIRCPAALWGFVQVIRDRRLAQTIDAAVHYKATEPERFGRLSGRCETPEQIAISRQRSEQVRKTLGQVAAKDREILTRFYLDEQSEEHIRSEMALTETQFRLLKWRAKTRFGERARKSLHRANGPRRT